MFYTVFSRCATTTLRYSGRIISSRHFSSGIDFDGLVSNNKVVVFMKGVPERPRCGFSGRVCQILNMHGVQYDAHDVLENLEIREGIKKYTNWPTIPQIFINGEFIGGCDILTQKHKSGELIEDLSRAGIKSTFLKEE